MGNKLQKAIKWQIAYLKAEDAAQVLADIANLTFEKLSDKDKTEYTEFFDKVRKSEADIAYDLENIDEKETVHKFPSHEEIMEKVEEDNENRKCQNFLDEIVKLSLNYNLSLSHEDQHGSFKIEEFDSDNIKWLKGAIIEV